MYFSVITPDEDLPRKSAYELLKSSYAEHQWLWQFFPSAAEQPRDFLFRRHQLDGLPRYYVVSHRLPQAGKSSWHVQSREYNPLLREGDRLSFELCANPVVGKKDALSKTRHHDVVMNAKKTGGEMEDVPHQELIQERCIEWLQQRSHKNGFELLNANADGYLQHQAGRRNIRYSTVEYAGVLEVTNPKQFKDVLFEGLGRCKAFGCGLMLVKRIAMD